ncbi:MAG: helix-turn-helix transcriptional regulator [Ilumatobacteraceae bacterium]
MDVTLQHQARALGDPTRHSIFRYISEAERPVDVAELTGHLGLNHNAIRQHLAKLVAARLVVESTQPRDTPGRRRLGYTIAPAADGRWDVTGPYERLSMMLVEVIRSGDPPVEVGRRVGRQRVSGSHRTDQPVSALVDQMARYGFEPDPSERAGSIRIILRRCPYASAAVSDAATVCGLHLGIAHGVAESLGGITVDELRPKDPRTANCILRCHTNRPAAGDDSGTAA